MLWLSKIALILKQKIYLVLNSILIHLKSSEAYGKFIVYNIFGEHIMTKTIEISEKTHGLLSELVSKNETFNDVIYFLIGYYHKHEEFSNKQVEAYNRDIEKFEKGDVENVSELTLSELEKRLTKLETDIKK